MRDCDRIFGQKEMSSSEESSESENGDELHEEEN